MQALGAAVAGVTFGLGLVLSGMAMPVKVLAFLDVAGAWDPSLAFVMAGAIAVYAPLYRYTVRNTTPLWGERYLLTLRSDVDASLLGGAALFGVGWGLSGLCPGPAIVSAGSGARESLTFMASMIAGMALFEVYQRLRLAKQPTTTGASAAP